MGDKNKGTINRANSSSKEDKGKIKEMLSMSTKELIIYLAIIAMLLWPISMVSQVL